RSRGFESRFPLHILRDATVLDINTCHRIIPGFLQLFAAILVDGELSHCLSGRMMFELRLGSECRRPPISVCQLSVSRQEVKRKWKRRRAARKKSKKTPAKESGDGVLSAIPLSLLERHFSLPPEAEFTVQHSREDLTTGSSQLSWGCSADGLTFARC